MKHFIITLLALSALGSVTAMQTPRTPEEKAAFIEESKQLIKKAETSRDAALIASALERLKFFENVTKNEDALIQIKAKIQELTTKLAQLTQDAATAGTAGAVAPTQPEKQTGSWCELM